MNDTNEEHGNSGFWFGLAIGGLVGAAAAYLATTDEKERKKLLKKGKQILGSLEDFGGEVIEKGKEVKEVVTDKFEEVGDFVEEKTPVVAEAAQEAMAKVQETAQDAIARIEEAAENAGDQAHQFQKSAKKFFLHRGLPVRKR